MQESDAIRFIDAMHALAETYGLPRPSAARIEGYFQAMMDVPMELVRLACTRATRTCHAFPLPADLREAIRCELAEQHFRAERAKGKK